MSKRLERNSPCGFIYTRYSYYRECHFEMGVTNSLRRKNREFDRYELEPGQFVNAFLAKRKDLSRMLSYLKKRLKIYSQFTMETPGPNLYEDLNLDMIEKEFLKNLLNKKGFFFKSLPSSHIDNYIKNGCLKVRVSIKKV